MRRFFEWIGYSKEGADKAGVDAEVKLTVDVLSKGIQYFVFGGIALFLGGLGTLIYLIFQILFLLPWDEVKAIKTIVSIASISTAILLFFVPILVFFLLRISKKMKGLNQLITLVNDLKKDTTEKFVDLKGVIETLTPMDYGQLITPKGYMFSSTIFSHTIHNKKRFTNIRQYKIRCIKESLSSWTGKYRWTGDKATSVIAETNNISVLNRGETKNKSAIQYSTYDVNFTSPLSQGEVCEFKLRWELSDKKEQALRVIGSVIAEQTDLFTIILHAPPNFKIRAYKEEAFATEVLDSVTFPSNEQNTYTWEIPNPKIGHSYSIWWEYI